MTYLHIQIWVQIKVHEDLLVVVVLGLHLLGLVVAEVITKRHQEDVGLEQLGLLSVLIQEEGGPLSYVCVINGNGVDAPGTGGLEVEGGDATEVKLAADLQHWISS